MKPFKQENFASIVTLSLALFVGLAPAAFAADIPNLPELGATDVIDWSVTHPAGVQSFTVGHVTLSEQGSVFKQLIQGSVGWAGNFPTGTTSNTTKNPAVR
jgi:hypothetical protein